MKQEIMDFINETIEAEMGTPIKADDKLCEAGLDSLGMSLMLITVDSKYPILKDVPKGQEFEGIDVENITMKELVRKCVLSITDTGTEQS